MNDSSEKSEGETQIAGINSRYLDALIMALTIAARVFQREAEEAKSYHGAVSLPGYAKLEPHFNLLAAMSLRMAKQFATDDVIAFDQREASVLEMALTAAQSHFTLLSIALLQCGEKQSAQILREQAQDINIVNEILFDR